MCTQITYTEIMPPEKLKQGPLPVEDRAFYGLVWAGNTLTARVGQAHEVPPACPGAPPPRAFDATG